MEMYDNLREVISDDTTPPITPSVGNSTQEEESLDEGMVEDLSDGTLETRSSSDDAWKPSFNNKYGDTSSINTEDSMDTSTTASSTVRRQRSEGGKRVTFAQEEFLVRVIFIPIDTGPCLEELTPCDPGTLVDEVSEMTIEGYSPVSTPRGGGGSGSSGVSSSNRKLPTSSTIPPGRTSEFGTSAAPVARFGRGFLGGYGAPGVGKFATPSMKALGRGLCLQGRPITTSPKPAPRKRPSTSGHPHDRIAEQSDCKHIDTLQKGSQNKESIDQNEPLKNGSNLEDHITQNGEISAASASRRNIRSANAFGGRRRLQSATPEERLEPLFKHANRKIRSAAWSGKNSEVLPSRGELQGHLHTRRLQGFTSRSTSSLHRIQSINELKTTNLNRARSISCDSVTKAMSATAGRAAHTANSTASRTQGLTTTSSFVNRKFQTGKRTLTRRSLPVRPDQTSSQTIEERLSPLNATSGPFPRVHQSPYRQSTLPPLGLRSATFLEPGLSAAAGRDRNDARSDVSASPGQVHAMKHVNTPLATRKLYAWHMANGNLGANAHLETPCISPLWDYLPKASDSTVPATSLS